MISWVRLWHDMPTDPKFRAIARAAKQPLSAVIAVYTFMLTDASANAAERGQTHANDETVGSALDLDDEAVSAIRSAMQGRVLDGSTLSGWDKRQPKREDDSADRAKAWRELKKAQAEIERRRTQANAGERQEEKRVEEKREEKEEIPPPLEPRACGDEGDFKSGGGVLLDLIEGRETGFDEAASRLRKLWNEQGLEPPDMGRVALWLDEGHSVESIVGAIRDVFNGSGKKAKSLTYFDAALARAKPAPKSSNAAPSIPTIYVRQLDPAWPAYVEAYRTAKGKDPPTDRAGGWHFPLDLIPKHASH